MSLNDTTQDTPVKLCECGCGRPAPIAKCTRKKHGIIKGQPTRFAVGHARRRATNERFWEKVKKNAVSGCWEWTGTHVGFGHGYFSVGSKKVLAHRFSYELHNGPIPDGMFCCHTCDNPTCVNPAHLYLGTHAQNMADMVSKNRHKHGSAHHSAKLTEPQVIEIRRKYAQESATQKELANEYGVAPSAIAKIVTRKRWTHIP